MYIYHMSKTPQIFWLIFALFLMGNTLSFAQYHDPQNTDTLMQPSYLKQGDSVAIVAPSGILKNKENDIDLAERLLRSWGLKPVLGAHLFSKDNHFAGTDTERTSDFQKALDDPSIKAIWCARGGYGSVRILDKLDWTNFKKYPKWVIGYSDITAIHNQIHIEGFESIHALMCSSLQDDKTKIAMSIDTFKDAISGQPLDYQLKASKYNKPGSVTGLLVGGNLTLLHTMLGSKTSIDVAGKILFIEEIGEYKYHIDRMLQSLKRAGYFEQCKGLIVGDMTKLRKNTTKWGASIEQLILDALKEYDFPIAFKMPAGHEDDNRAMILGRTIDLTITKQGSNIHFHK